MRTTIEIMKQVVSDNGGSISEEDYLKAIQEECIAEGRDSSITSLKSNAFSANRMHKAGIVRVSIGKDKQVWEIEAIKATLEGRRVESTPAPVAHEYTKVSDLMYDPKTVSPKATPQGGVFYGIPKRHPDEFEAHVQTMIPTPRGFVESDRQEFRLMAMCYQETLKGNSPNSHMILEGPKGCGKSMLAQDFYGHINTPLLQINMSDGITEDTFIGSRTIVDGDVVFQDGVLTLAMEYGLGLLADELNAAREACLIATHAAMDRGTLVIGEDNNRVVKAKNGFQIIATMNPPEDYAGVNAMNQATKDRFTMNLTFDYLKEDKEVEVVMGQSGFTDEDTVRGMVKVANDLRQLKKEGLLETDTSTRTLVQMFGLMSQLSLNEAIEYSMLGKYNADERPHIEAACRARLADY